MTLAVAAVVMVAVLLYGLGNARALSIVLIPVEPDARERALIVAAGSGDVPAVRALLAQGVRPEPETFNAAVTGAFEPWYGSSGCVRHAEVARLLLDANPRLRPGNRARALAVRRAAWIRGCDEVYRLIAN